MEIIKALTINVVMFIFCAFLLKTAVSYPLISSLVVGFIVLGTIFMAELSIRRKK